MFWILTNRTFCCFQIRMRAETAHAEKKVSSSDKLFDAKPRAVRIHRKHIVGRDPPGIKVFIFQFMHWVLPSVFAVAAPAYL